MVTSSGGCRQTLTPSPARYSTEIAFVAEDLSPFTGDPMSGSPPGNAPLQSQRLHPPAVQSKRLCSPNNPPVLSRCIFLPNNPPALSKRLHSPDIPPALSSGSELCSAVDMAR